MQNLISFSIESIISRKDPPKDRPLKSVGQEEIRSSAPISATTNFLQVYTPKETSNFRIPSHTVEKGHLQDGTRTNGESVREKLTGNVSITALQSSK